MFFFVCTYWQTIFVAIVAMLIITATSPDTPS